MIETDRLSANAIKINSLRENLKDVNLNRILKNQSQSVTFRMCAPIQYVPCSICIISTHCYPSIDEKTYSQIDTENRINPSHSQ